ncbi:MAG: hypothetical protein KGK11_13385 [Sphingomonadales bacterium]|nr:hypothetical protein [Sphingomonadales bacterium]
MTDLMQTRPVYEQAAVIDGRHYSALGQAALRLGGPSADASRSGQELCLRLLQSDELASLRRHPAPHHERPEFAGDVILDAHFWRAAWWFNFSGRDTTASGEWREWLLQGGIMVPTETLDSVAEQMERERQIALETSIRRAFQYRWPATHVLAWIISRDKNAVDSMDIAREIDRLPAWERLVEIADSYAQGAQTRENVMFAAFDELVTALDCGRLKAWEVSPPYPPYRYWSELGSDAFATAGLMIGQNSCGLLGATFGARALPFILIRPDDVKALWPANGIRAPEAEPRPFTDAERRAWIAAQPQMSADMGHTIFKAHPQFDGTKQDVFRIEWAEVRGTKRGAPPKSVRKSVLTN